VYIDQMSVHPLIPTFADITHNTVHDDRINVRCRSSPSVGQQAAGIVICPGVGFDVIPADCLAAVLKQA
jgi:hypothetical protein